MVPRGLDDTADDEAVFGVIDDDLVLDESVEAFENRTNECDTGVPFDRRRLVRSGSCR
jgi:hypothetical protein